MYNKHAHKSFTYLVKTFSSLFLTIRHSVLNYQGGEISILVLYRALCNQDEGSYISSLRGLQTTQH